MRIAPPRAPDPDMDAVIEFLGNVIWWRVIVTLVFTAVAVAAGIWWPARLLEAHTNQPLVRWGWYIVGTLALAMIYTAMYGYGQFWVLYRESEVRRGTTSAAENRAP